MIAVASCADCRYGFFLSSVHTWDIESISGNRPSTTQLRHLHSHYCLLVLHRTVFASSCALLAIWFSSGGKVENWSFLLTRNLSLLRLICPSLIYPPFQSPTHGRGPCFISDNSNTNSVTDNLCQWKMFKSSMLLVFLGSLLFFAQAIIAVPFENPSDISDDLVWTPLSLSLLINSVALCATCSVSTFQRWCFHFEQASDGVSGTWE